MSGTRFCMAASAALLALGFSTGAQADFSKMTFFITSVGSGKGADFGGLAGADRHCQKLAHEAGASYRRTWRAYLSQSAWGNQLAVHARDRIGSGPWHNARGELIAKDLDELHGKNNLTKKTALTEKWDVVNGRGDKPNMHDILTGSKPDGTAFEGNDDRTCNNWRSSGAGSAVVGHHDRIGLRDDEPSRSWNSSHPSRGCSLPALQSSGGAGLLYCFATGQ